MRKKDKINELFKILVTKMLEKHNVDYDYVTKNQEIDGNPWIEHFTWTVEEEEEFKEWAIALCRKKMRWSKRESEAEISWFLLNWGLLTKNE